MNVIDVDIDHYCQLNIKHEITQTDKEKYEFIWGLGIENLGSLTFWLPDMTIDQGD